MAWRAPAVLTRLPPRLPPTQCTVAQVCCCAVCIKGFTPKPCQALSWEPLTA